MRALDELKQMRGVFGAASARRTSELLKQLSRTRLKNPDDLIALHEAVLYLRAYPQSPGVLRLADKILNSFAERIGDPAAFDDPEISGIAGTSVSTTYSHEFAESLVRRHGRAIQIDWENFARPDRLGPVLAQLLPAAAEAWAVEPYVDWRAWFENARCTPAWLLAQVEPRAYDLIEIPLKWSLGNSPAARSRTRIPRREIYYHQGPLLRRKDVSIEGEFAAPRFKPKRLSKAAAQRIVNVIVDTSAVRYRELWGFLHPDLKHVRHVDFGRGVDFYYFGVPPEDRLPIRAYHAGMYFKNGVPLGYFEGLSLYDRMEAGFNLYYTFRDGETAWLYARTLKLFREQLGVTCFSIDPYQIGHENEEAIESGAFWFYRKLGFRPSSQDVARLAEREEAKIARSPEYRTPASVLRKLAVSPMIYGEGRMVSAVDLARRADRTRGLPWSRELIEAKFAAEETRFLRQSRKRA